MPDAFTIEHLLAIHPSARDDSKGLSVPAKWIAMGRDARAAWGTIQGSGAEPYRTLIDLAGTGASCTCPSRRRPCKHALGLMVIAAEQGPLVEPSPPPPWVADWLASRRAPSGAEEKADKKDKEILDPEAKEKRAREREAKVTAGFADLEVWLLDLVRRGLAAAQAEPVSFWEQQAARLVDAQANGAARMVRMMGNTIAGASDEEWPARLLARMARLHLLIEGWKRIAQLPAGAQADVRSAIGFTQSQDELRLRPGVRDVWRVMGQRTDADEDERFVTQRLWLRGMQAPAAPDARDGGAPRDALILQFGAARQSLPVVLATGSTIEAELVFFPSATPQRALLKERFGMPGSMAGIGATLSSAPRIADALAADANVQAKNPWLESVPLAIAGVAPIAGTGREPWRIADSDGRTLMLSPRFEQKWELLAIAGGRPIEVFGEWDGERLLPLSALAEGRFVAL